jgi:hypothetical protein
MGFKAGSSRLPNEIHLRGPSLIIIFIFASESSFVTDLILLQVLLLIM